MQNPTSFYCRAKPQGVDAFKIFDQAEHVFIGYPLIRKHQDGTEFPYDPTCLDQCLVNPMIDSDWDEQIQRHKQTKGFKSQQFNKNRNFAKKISIGSIVVIPRAELGSVYLGRVVSDFKIIGNPGWAADYMTLREDKKLNIDDSKKRHIADVCQGWKVDGYKRVDLSKLPAWLRRSLFGRSTFGTFSNHPLDPTITASACLQAIYDGDSILTLEWTEDLDEVKKRLIENLATNSFEHLVVSLLQLEHTDEIWHQTGGAGDGGIDGLGSDQHGNVTGIMQAKFYSDVAPALPELTHGKIRRYAAVLLPEHPKSINGDTTLLDINWVAKKTIEHASRLPLAITMRVRGPFN